MADASRVDILSMPAGFGVGAPARWNTPLPPSIVRRISITWPAGCGGLVFLQIQAAGGFAFPSFQDQYLAFDDYTYTFDVSNQINNGNWSVVGYNTDAIGHDPIIVFEYDYLREAVSNSVTTPIAL